MIYGLVVIFIMIVLYGTTILKQLNDIKKQQKFLERRIKEL